MFMYLTSAHDSTLYVSLSISLSPGVHHCSLDDNGAAELRARPAASCVPLCRLGPPFLCLSYMYRPGRDRNGLYALALAFFFLRVSCGSITTI